MSETWLHARRGNRTSQHGEDGVIEAIFEKLGTRNKFCVDVGAGNGIYVSNTYKWVREQGWSGLMLEAGDQEHAALEALYADRADVVTAKEFVTPEGIEALLSKHDVPEDFDLFDLDIDGMDFHVWRAMETYRPRVVVVEINCSVHSDIELVQTRPDLRMGTSIRAMVNLAKQKGYELAAHLVSNAVFVRREEFEKLEIGDNSIERLFQSPFVAYVVSDLDGVHYLVKEGPWGFSGMVWEMDARPSEDGRQAAIRAVHSTTNDGKFIARRDPKSRFVATIEGTPEQRRILVDYAARMVAENG